SMVVEYGMSEKLGPLQFGDSNGQVFLGKDMQSDPNYSDAIAYEIDQEMQNNVTTQYEHCHQILTDHKEQLTLIAETLLVEETLDREQIEELFYNGKLPERNFEDHTVDEDEDKVGPSYEDVKKDLDSDSDDDETEERGMVEREETSREYDRREQERREEERNSQHRLAEEKSDSEEPRQGPEGRDGELDDDSRRN